MSAPGTTPGPWKVDGEEIVCVSDGSFICMVGGGDEKQDAADRRLIAAAPELYEALDHIRELLVAYGPRYVDKATKLADAALSRARGEEVGNG